MSAPVYVCLRVCVQVGVLRLRKKKARGKEKVGHMQSQANSLSFLVFPRDPNAG